MRPAPLPQRARHQLRRAVQGAVQPSSAPPTSALVGKYSLGRSATSDAYQERQHLQTYQDWQPRARRYARKSGVARFAANMIASTAGRCILRVEERTDRGDWNETEAGALGVAMDRYRNDILGQGSSELVRLHTYHYAVSGEGCLVTVNDARGHAQWLVVSMPAIEWDQPRKGEALVKLHPAGQQLDGTAVAVSRDLVFHYWMPDEEWLSMAVSPMTAAMDDLARYQSLARLARRQANSPLAMAGLLWTPGSAHETENLPGDDHDDQDGVEGAEPQESPFLKMYKEWARTSYGDEMDDTLESVLPPVAWWDGEPPQHVDLGGSLDEHGIAYRQEALADFARDVDAPASLVISGGGSDENHWGAWMTKERFLAAVAPTLDRVCHQDLTVAYLQPMLRFAGIPEHQIPNYRVGYDATPVIKAPDESDKALRAWLAGLLGMKPALEKMGFDPDDLAGPEDLERLAAVLSNFSGNIPTTSLPQVSGPEGLPAGPENVNELPPAEPGQLAAALNGYLPVALRPRERVVVRPVAPSTPHRVAAALNPTGKGVMVSLDLPDDVAGALAVPGGEPPETMHITLAHVTKEHAAEDPTIRDALRSAAEGTAASVPPAVELTHVERFVAMNDDGLEPVVLVDHHPDVYALRDRLAALLDGAGVPYSDDHGFRCHVTLGYWKPGEGPQPGALAQPVRFVPRAVALHWGDEIEEFEFTHPSGPPVEEQPVIEAAARDVTPTELIVRAATKELRGADRLFRRLARIRRDTGRELLAAAEIAFAEAIRHAGTRMKGKAKNKARNLSVAVAAAIEAGTSLSPFMGALGTTEADLLHGAFQTFEPQAAQRLASAQAEERAAMIDAGYDPSQLGEASESRAGEAATFLAAALLALARQRLIAGSDPVTLAGPGEISGDIPAQLVAQAVGVAQGRLTATLGASPDEVPAVYPMGGQRAEDVVSRGLQQRITAVLTVDDGVEIGARARARILKAAQRAAERPPTEYVWVHGFWASPRTVFPPHRNRSGFRTTNPEQDPALANPGPWPDPGAWPFYQPGDHLGCSCEQVAQVDPAVTEAVAALT